MTAKEPRPNLAQDLVRIHKAITRGLTVAVTKGGQFMREGFPDESMRRGFADYVQSLGFVLGAHHLGEDEIAFPALRARLPAAPYGRLAADHQKIEGLLGPLREAIGHLVEGGTGDELQKVVEGLRSITLLWSPHIELEEMHFAEKAVGDVMQPDEQAKVSGAMGKHSQEHAGPPFLALPFVLFNLEREDRAEFAAALPKAVREELIPHEWKDKWAPMKPFLLG